MKRSYVLDENVAFCGATGRNERGQDDRSSLTLLAVLFDKCHRLAYSRQLWAKWQSKLSALSNSGAPLSDAVFAYLNLFKDTQGKFDYIDEPEPLQSQQGINEDDVFLVTLAVCTGSPIVTTDNELIEELQKASVRERYGLTLLRPEQALARLADSR